MPTRNFCVEGEPKGKGRPRATMVGGHARAYTPAETAVYENHVAQSYLAIYGGTPPFKGPVHVQVQALFPYPKSAFWPVNRNHNGELREEWVGAEHVKTPDADNVLKAILDGLNKSGAWADDSQVSAIHISKGYSKHPCVYVRLEGEI